MTRPEDIKTRIGNIRDIESIVTTLRAMSVLHQQEARTHLVAIRSQAATVAGALASVLSAGTPQRPSSSNGPDRSGDGMTIVVGVAQGFSGAFAGQIAEAALAEAAAGRRLLVVGNRTLATLAEADVAPLWSSELPPRPANVPSLASQLADALFDLLAKSAGTSVTILFGDPDSPGQPVIERRLFPFDFGRFPTTGSALPLTTMSPDRLVAALATEYVFTELCEALMLGFAAEDAARVAAMSRAQTNVKKIRAELTATYQRARQEQTTTEIVELSSANLGNRSGRGRTHVARLRSPAR